MPMMMLPTICSAKIATIGVRSSGPMRRGSGRKIRRYGSVTSRKKPRIPLTAREYGSRAPIDRMKLMTMWAMMQIR